VESEQLAILFTVHCLLLARNSLNGVRVCNSHTVTRTNGDTCANQVCALGRIANIDTIEHSNGNIDPDDYANAQANLNVDESFHHRADLNCRTQGGASGDGCNFATNAHSIANRECR
jgi:hypothetical protein